MQARHLRLYVNVDHVATLREARRGDEPSPIEAAAICERAGADGITAHLREDRRHIQDADVERLATSVSTYFNLEAACVSDMISIAVRLRPPQVTLVPERREEVTTEGGLAVNDQPRAVRDAVERLRTEGNVGDVAAIGEIEELNIGHSIVSRALFIGLEAAVREIRNAMDAARGTVRGAA